MARPRKRLDEMTKNLTKSEIMARAIEEDSTRVSRNLKAPKWLSKKATEIFNNTVNLLNTIKVLDDLDIPILSAYADCYARLQEIAKKIDVEGYTTKKVGKFGDTTIISNPNLKIYTDLQKNLRDNAVKLGLNSIDRTKLISVDIKKDEELDPFERFI